jgi:hypothetical protein
MKHFRRLAAGMTATALVSLGLALFTGCVGDPTTGPDGSMGPDSTTGDTGGNDGDMPDSAVGCDARTADDKSGIFVAQTGSDVSSCGTRANPCKTLTYSISLAKSMSGKTALYVAGAQMTDAGAMEGGSPGVYQESIIVDAPLTIEGGWSDIGGKWTPICDSTTSTAVTIQGTTNTTVTASFAGTATLRDIRVTSKPAANPGESLYGIFVLGATTKVTLDQVVVNIAAGGAGTDGMDGMAGANANDGGCAPGSGANGGAGAAGTGGGAGTFTSNGFIATNGGTGTNGGAGQNGTVGGMGQCQNCDIFAGSCPNSCGFGTKMTCGQTGLSGCGGGSGGAGTFGTGGGASLALFIWDAQVTVFGGSFTTSSGGKGGNGGNGADGGTATNGAAGSQTFCATGLSNPTCFMNSCTGTLVSSINLTGGTAGGNGGVGGVGGHGGGGGGGWSYAIVAGGDGGVALNGGPMLMHGTGGPGGVTAGANGVSGDKWP